MNGSGSDGGVRSGVVAGDVVLSELMRSERRHAAVMFLSTGIAIGIAFSLLLDRMASAAVGP